MKSSRGKRDRRPAKLKRPTADAPRQEEGKDIRTDVPVGAERREGLVAHRPAAATSMADEEPGTPAEKADMGHLKPLRRSEP